MLIDITLKITEQMLEDAKGLSDKGLAGHLGTHFDVMNKEFPLEYTERKGIIFDVSGIADRDIDVSDIDMSKVEADMFVCFYTGFIEKVGYGEKGYFSEHPQLSEALIEALLDKGISIIALDFAGIRRGKEHTPKDQYCADRDVFVIENLCNLKTVLDAGDSFTAYTYPISCEKITGLPCRVVAKV